MITFRKKIFRIFAPLFFLSFCLLPKAHSQNPPPGQDVGAQSQSFKDKTQAERQQIEKKKIKAPEIEYEKEKPKPSAAGPAFVLKGIKITDTAIFTPQEFRPLYQSLIDTKVTFADIDAITEKIKAKYKARGYLTTLVYVPQQDIKDGIIEIKIAEGKMGQLKVEGNKWFSAGWIEKFFHSKKNEILNIKTVQRDILRLNQNPDLQVKTVISPGREAETSDITLQIQEKMPWHLGASFDNQGTRLTGKWRPAVYIRSSNLSGNGDSIFINSLYTQHSFGESISYALPIGTYGTKAGIDMTYYKMKLGKEYKSFDITGKTQIYTPHVSWELALTEYYQANFNLGLDIKSIVKKTSGEVTSSDQLRIPYFSFDFSKMDSFGGQTTFSPRFDFGTGHFLGASKRDHPTSSRAGSGGFFFKYEQGLGRIQKMPWDSYITVNTQFQVPSHTLPSSEQLQLGGANSIRGYPEGDYLADFGGYMTTDWVFPNYLIPKDWKVPHSDIDLRHAIEPAIFVDFGGGKLKKVLPGEKYDKFLVGVGMGLRFRFSHWMYCKLDWAQRLGDRPTGGVGPSTFYLTFRSEL